MIERTGLPRTKAEAAVDTVFEGLKQALTAGERIELRGFGVFSVRATGPRCQGARASTARRDRVFGAIRLRPSRNYRRSKPVPEYKTVRS